jgi:hypothetical protein
MQNAFMRPFICCFFSIIFLSCNSQSPNAPVTDSTTPNGEFYKNANGLIYSSEDIAALRFIVDSLNLRFKTCDLNKKYLSYPQARAKFIRFRSKTSSLLDVKKDIENGMQFDALLKTHRRYITETDTGILVLKTPVYKNEAPGIITGSATDGFEENRFLTDNLPVLGKTWALDYEKKGEYSDYYSIGYWFFAEDFTQPVIPDNYARLVQYIDCMIDTAAYIFTGKKEGDVFERNQSGKAAAYYKQINNYLNGKMKLKKKPDDYSYDYLSEDKIKYATEQLGNDAYLKNKLALIADEYAAAETGNDAMETLIAFFVSKQKALDIKRRRIVYGNCSMDNSPREHAKNIAALAAETHSWDIFLRAHLNIMNDRFNRVSDGSYAWGTRETYIKELETLDINVLDMMLGLSLRAYNNSPNHYNGTVWRIGKALTESKDSLLFEQRAKDMLKDTKLDQFNRSLIFLLYHTYLNYMPGKEARKRKVNSLKKEKAAYPDFIQTAIENMKTELPD